MNGDLSVDDDDEVPLDVLHKWSPFAILQYCTTALADLPAVFF